MREFKFGDTFAVKYPNHPNMTAGFVVGRARPARNEPALICYNQSLPTTLAEHVGAPIMDSGDRFTVEGVAYKVDNNGFALGVTALGLTKD